MNDSRIPGLYKLSIAERIAKLEQAGWLTANDADALRCGRHILPAAGADRMIENVVGVFALPFAVAPNLRVNDRDYIVPLAVEEPSIVAALSHAAALARKGGGLTASCDESLLAGQVHVTNHDASAASAIESAAADLLAAANAVHPRLSARGGGARRIEVRELELADGTPSLAVHVLVDTCDAMGANLVNTMCEALAPQIAKLTGGNVALRILSNLCDDSVVSATVTFSPGILASPGFDGAVVRDGIVLANAIATADPYRAATHNKGIMNGIDPLAIATGNDWRAIEAGAHAYAARSGLYRALTEWSVADSGGLVGRIDIPLKVGTVGGTLRANPAASLAVDMLGVESALDLAFVMAAAGLLQNFAALRALATAGIQKGHMRLHARGLVASAGAPEALFDDVVDRLVASGDIKLENARRLVDQLSVSEARQAKGAAAAGKVILLGEHAVVYGKHALAVPIPDAVSAVIDRGEGGMSLRIPEWNFSKTIDPAGADGVDALVMTIANAVGVTASGFDITVHSRLPRGMGLGSSAAIAVAIVRAFDGLLCLGLDDERVNEIAFECEKHAHGTPSGVDNTLATFARPMLFRNPGTLQVSYIEPPVTLPLLVAWGAEAGDTREQVRGVRERRGQEPQTFDALFDEIDRLSQQGAEAFRAEDIGQLGRLMNVCHGLLNAIGVSTPEIERMVDIARRNGACGAKLTGAGGGGSIVALCPGRLAEVRQALHAAGYRTLEVGDDDARE